jgi:hypothetical protein
MIISFNIIQKAEDKPYDPALKLSAGECRFLPLRNSGTSSAAFLSGVLNYSFISYMSRLENAFHVRG